MQSTQATYRRDYVVLPALRAMGIGVLVLVHQDEVQHVRNFEFRVTWLGVRQVVLRCLKAHRKSRNFSRRRSFQMELI